MSTASEVFLDRYKQVERQADTLGRVIGVRRLRISEQLKISEWTPALDGETDMVTDDGRVVKVSRRAMPMIGGAVCEIDGDRIPFSRNRGELDSMMDRLDQEGLAAAFAAMVKLQPSSVQDEAEGDQPILDEAKK